MTKEIKTTYFHNDNCLGGLTSVTAGADPRFYKQDTRGERTPVVQPLTAVGEKPEEQAVALPPEISEEEKSVIESASDKDLTNRGVKRTRRTKKTTTKMTDANTNEDKTTIAS